jgi:adenylate cyclase
VHSYSEWWEDNFSDEDRRMELDRARSIKSPTAVPTIDGTLGGTWTAAWETPTVELNRAVRRLAAILSADAFGYSRLMAADEEGTARALGACRQLISDCVDRYRGRVVDAPGDNVLAEFPSVVDAVRCAVEIQEALERRNAVLPAEERLTFRIGVNLGDIIVEDDRIVGSGVNVAARLEQLAEPGGICISGTAFDQVEDKLALRFKAAGKQTVKNIPKAVRVYRIGPGQAAGTTRTRKPPRRLTAIAVSVLALGAALFVLNRLPGVDDRSMPVANRRSVAVIPFENMSRDESHAPFVAGIHDDLLTHLSKIGAITTISRTSVMQYRDTTKTIPEIATELGVAAILEGAVQRSGDRVRINVQLIDAVTDQHLWAETYDRQLSVANIFAIQSEIASAIAEALRATLTADEQQRLAIVPTENLEALDTYFLGKQLLEERTARSLFAAVEYFQQVVKLDPDFALAHSGLADAYMLLPEYDAGVDLELVQEQSVAAAARALALDPDLPEVLATMAWNHLIHDYDWNEAEALLRRALSIQSNNTSALHWLSHVLSWQGQHAEAIRLAERAVDVDPMSRLMRMNRSYIYMDSGAFDRAIKLTAEGRKLDPDYPEFMGNLWLTYLRAGRPAEAAKAMHEWAAATGRKPEVMDQIGGLFVRHQQTGEPVHLEPDLARRGEFGLEDLGQVYAAVGDADGTIDALDRAVRERSGSRSVLSMRVNPLYDFIRDDPRFLALMERVGLKP